jgi:hypothetical protein
VSTAPSHEPRWPGPWVDSPIFAGELGRRRSTLTAEDANRAAAFHRDGCVLLRGAVPDDLVDRARAGVEPLVGPASVRPDGGRVGTVEDAWAGGGVAAVRELAGQPGLTRLLRMLYEREPIPFRTVNGGWGTGGWGSGGQPRCDASDFGSFPARYGCAVWVALEDIPAGGPPLAYYPGSHRLADGMASEELLRELDLEPVDLVAGKGDAFVRSSHLVWADRPLPAGEAPGWWQVTHYYFAGCVYYSPAGSDLATGELVLREVTDIGSMVEVAPTFDGEPVVVTRSPDGRCRLGRGPGGGAPAAAGAAAAAAGAPAAAAAAPEAPPAPAAQLADVVEMLAASRAEVEALRTSRSYRLGNALISPVKRLADALR